MLTLLFGLFFGSAESVHRLDWSPHIPRNAVTIAFECYAGVCMPYATGHPYDRFTVCQAVGYMRVAQPDVSNLLRGGIRGFFIYSMLEFLTALDQDVRVIIEPKRESRGKISVVAG